MATSSSTPIASEYIEEVPAPKEFAAVPFIHIEIEGGTEGAQAVECSPVA